MASHTMRKVGRWGMDSIATYRIYRVGHGNLGRDSHATRRPGPHERLLPNATITSFWEGFLCFSEECSPEA